MSDYDTTAQQPEPVDPHAGLPALPAGADVLYRGRTHPKILFRPLIAAVVLVTLHTLVVRHYPHDLGWEPLDHWGERVLHAVLAVLDLRYVIAPVARWQSSTFEITDRFIKMKWGVLYKNTREIHLDRIAQINEERGILDRMVGCGTIIVYDAATGGSAIHFNDVAHFKRVRRILDDARHQAHARPHLGRDPH